MCFPTGIEKNNESTTTYCPGLGAPYIAFSCIALCKPFGIFRLVVIELINRRKRGEAKGIAIYSGATEMRFRLASIP
jgi:hypothetical protein